MIGRQTMRLLAETSPIAGIGLAAQVQQFVSG